MKIIQNSGWQEANYLMRQLQFWGRSRGEIGWYLPAYSVLPGGIKQSRQPLFLTNRYNFSFSKCECQIHSLYQTDLSNGFARFPNRWHTAKTRRVTQRTKCHLIGTGINIICVVILCHTDFKGYGGPLHACRPRVGPICLTVLCSFPGSRGHPWTS